MVQIQSLQSSEGRVVSSVLSYLTSRRSIIPLVAVLGLVSVSAVSWLNASYDKSGQSRSITSSLDTTATASSFNVRTRQVMSDNVAQCRYFLAESAIPNSGLGVFTAIDIQKGEQAQSMPDICIYCTDTPKGTAFDSHAWGSFVWSPSGSFESHRKTRGACEGVATLVNTVPNHIKTSELVPLPIKHNAGLKRTHEPGAGAITQYYGTTTRAVRNVQAGAELTIDYGDWTFERNQEYKAPTRSVEYLRKHGWCIDNIKIDQATDRSHGRGAFARVKLPRGTMVAPAPVQFFPDRSVFEQTNPPALFLNYCYAIPGTTMLAYPYGPGVGLINHSRDKANVILQWSTSPSSHYPWLHLPVEQFWQMNYPGAIVMEVIATRDIAEGEELYMDYGEEWERAWQQHVLEWTPPAGAESYVYPGDMDRSQPFRTVQEQEKDPYPANLATVCHTNTWAKEPGVEVNWSQPKSPYPYRAFAYCHILKRRQEKDGVFVYEVALDEGEEGVFDPSIKRKDMFLNLNVPHDAIHFVERPYASDMHLPNAFRHTMALPTHLIPQGWVTLKSS